jgi:hypothetical protein
MRLSLSLSLSLSSSSSSWAATILLTTLLFLVTTTVQFVKADLKYYVYIKNDEETTKNDSNKVVVLESYGSLPLNESISTKDDGGDSSTCPTNNNSHTDEGSINPHYLCVGPTTTASSRHNNNSSDNSNNSSGNIEFFPISRSVASVDESSGGEKGNKISGISRQEHKNIENIENIENKKLPFKFSSFDKSYGTSSGLLLWRNVLAIDLSSFIYIYIYIYFYFYFCICY